MIRKILFFEAFIMLLCFSLKAQTLSPVVISSGGGFYNAGGNSLSFTVAEMTMVQTFTQPSNMLTQGFQQPEQLTTSIAETGAKHDEVVVFPNPSNGQFNINFNAQRGGNYQVHIYSMVGQIIYDQSYNAIFGSNIITIDISRFDQGIYFLEFRTTDPDGIQKSNIHKINLVY
jgi:hypothetical protein